MATVILFVVFFIAVAFIFDYVYGWHDAANSIATVVSTACSFPVWLYYGRAFVLHIAT
jgi:inorganic phosphate transporter, PiT family